MNHGHGVHEGWSDLWIVVPVLGCLVLLLALLAAGVWLWRRGVLLPTNSRLPAPEERARVILSERFANGDLSPEEFMERASLLNWTPGVADPDKRPVEPRKRHR